MSYDCTTLTGSEKEICEYLANKALTCSGALEYLLVTDGVKSCQNYTSFVEKMSGALGEDGIIDTGNNAWMILCAALVMIMTPGVGLFYAGLAGEETSANILMMAFGSMGVVTLQWFILGYSFAFGPGTSTFGSFVWGAMDMLGGKPSYNYGWGIAHLTWAVFQCMFAQITPALISGAVVGRMKFTSFLVFVALWTTCVYDPLAHWVWAFTPSGSGISNGWLFDYGALDFAGGAVIHVSSGFAALACAIVLGKRSEKTEKPHNVPMVITGAAFLWFGWFGFNAGSAGGSANVGGNPFGGNAFVNGLAATAFLNTHFAACTATLSWLFIEKVVTRKVTASGAAIGCVAGLVAITPACGFVEPWAAIVIGFIVSPFCYLAMKIIKLTPLDDALDCWAIHGMGGIVGACCTGIFASPSVNPLGTGAVYGDGGVLLGKELAAVTVSATFSFTVTLIIMLVLKFSPLGVRISEEDEKMGIDVSEHGGKSYQ